MITIQTIKNIIYYGKFTSCTHKKLQPVYGTMTEWQCTKCGSIVLGG